MQRLWSADELGERWSLAPEDLALLADLPDAGRLGLAAQLAYWRQHGRFPDEEADLAPAVVGHLAAQVGVAADALDGYDWTGRTGRRHRRLILDHLAVAAFEGGDLGRASTLGQESFVLYKRLGDKAGIALALLFVTLPFVVRAVQPVLLELDREMEEAATSLGASPRTTFRRIVLPNLMPAILSGAALSFARAVGEFGSVVLISGNKPFDTQVSSVYIFSQVESDNIAGAAAVSVVLLALSLVVLFAIRLLERRGTRHAR